MFSQVATPPPIGLRAYARHRKAAGLAGGTHHAVQVAIADGRLSKSLTSDRKRIADVAAADVEWAATTHADRVPRSGPTSPPELHISRARFEAARADTAEFELAKLRDEFVPVEEARSVMINKFTTVKTKLLGVPSRLGQRERSFTLAQLALVDEMIRDVLTELADRDDDDDDDDDDA